jgi:putative colanic acid biosynthesis glycosyltransferase
MKKIFQICVEGNTGSTGTIAESFGQYALNQGWSSFIAYGRFPRSSKSNLIKIGNSFDIIMHGLETRLMDGHGLASKNATYKLIDTIKQISPDIIQLHHLHGYYINYKILFEFLRTCKFPVVWTFHDCWSFTGHCAYFERAGCEKWKSKCFDCPQIHEYPKSFFWDRSAEHFHLKKTLFTSLNNLTIVSVSRWLDKLVSESFFQGSNHLFIHNGVDTAIFSPVQNVNPVKIRYKLNGKFILLGVASTWDSRKGLSDFIEISKFLKSDEIILLIGLSKQQIDNLPFNIIGLPRTENKAELIELYSAADVFLNLSVEESFGLTTIESLACGTPAIVYDNTASPELISVGTGFIVKPGDISTILNCVQSIKVRGKNSFSSICRDHVVKNFEMKDRFADYFNLYDSIVDS